MKFKKLFLSILTGIIALSNLQLCKIEVKAERNHPFKVIDNNTPIYIGYNYLMESDEPLMINKKQLGKSVTISNKIGTYGNLREEGNYYIYTLKDFLNGVEEFNINIDGNDEILRIVPAKKMVYDDDFVGIEYSGNYEKRYDLNFYGKSATLISSPATLNEEVRFYFSGTGIEAFTKITPKPLKIVYRLFEKNESTGEYDNRLASYVKDLTGVFNAYRQRIFKLNYTDKNLDKYFCIIVGKGQGLYVDYFRILNPLGVDNLPSYVVDLYDKLDDTDFDLYNNHYIHKTDSTYKVFKKHLLDSVDTNTGDNKELIFENMEGKYGTLVECVETNGNITYQYQLKGVLSGVDTFKYYVNGIPKILRIIPYHAENVDDTMPLLDRKDTTSSLDLYIKSENILSMSIDTNSIVFEDFSGIEDMVKENAVQISINSSLPYQLNAYLPTEIQNGDKSNTMDKGILNIKENSEFNYQTFTNITDKIVLKDNCSAGNDLIHGVDVKLKGGIAHEKDVYKTTIKLEAEQK